MRGYGVLILFFGLIAALGSALGCAARPVVDKELVLSHPDIQADVRAQLKHGDWIVIRGVSGADNFIATVTNSVFSHSAIYDAERSEVIEADGSGVHAAPLAEYLGKAHRTLVIRPMWAEDKAFRSNEENAKSAVDLARSWLGRPYNYTGLVGLSIPDRYYCTQLSLMAYKPIMEAEHKQAGKPKAFNPIPPVIEPAQMYHWGRIVYDSGSYR